MALKKVNSGRRSSAGKLLLNSFFSGIGGFELGFERNGFTPIFSCEIDPFCRGVLSRHWQGISISDDIEELESDDIQEATVWTAGFPCQDVSLARTPHGRTGLRGKQSGLFFKFHELLAAQLPEVVVLENVAGLLNSHNGADFRLLLESLTGLGYGVAWRVLNARYFGVPQSRPRIFICAWKNSPEKAASVLFERQQSPMTENERRGFIVGAKCRATGAHVPELAFCISATSGRHTGLDWARSYIAYEDAVRRLTPLECERLQGFPDGWTIPHDSYELPSRGIDNERYRTIGNAVCVPVVEWVAQRIYSLLTNKPSSLRRSTDLPARLMAVSEDFATAPGEGILLRETPKGKKWRSGGCAFNDFVLDVPASTSPVSQVSSRFIEIVEKRCVDSRYYLTPNAAKGIIRRVDKMGRNLFPPLDASLRRLASVESCSSFEQDDVAEALL